LKYLQQTQVTDVKTYHMDINIKCKYATSLDLYTDDIVRGIIKDSKKRTKATSTPETERN